MDGLSYAGFHRDYKIVFSFPFLKVGFYAIKGGWIAQWFRFLVADWEFSSFHVS